MILNYLDNAATSFPKPKSVRRELDRCLGEYCGNPGRGSHRMALLASEKLFEARGLVASLTGCPSPENVVFTLNATYALNLVILGLIKEGDHVLISDLEHNSVLRPVEYLRQNKGAEYSIFSTSGDVLENIKRLVRKNTRAVICTHASNITNRVLPLCSIGKMLREMGILFIVDASQSIGRVDIDVEKMCIDALCAPGHKGLLAPQGIGFAILGKDILPSPLITGGSGSSSRLLTMPDELPDRLEGGTMPTPSAAGLCEGIKYLLSRGLDDVRKKEWEVISAIKGEFEDDRRIFTYSEGEGGIWLFNVKGVSSQRISQLLDKYGICTRPGLHCAPLAHKSLATPPDGAVRVSAGALTKSWQAEHFVRTLRRILDCEI